MIFIQKDILVFMHFFFQIKTYEVGFRTGKRVTEHEAAKVDLLTDSSSFL